MQYFRVRRRRVSIIIAEISISSSIVQNGVISVLTRIYIVGKKRNLKSRQPRLSSLSIDFLTVFCQLFKSTVMRKVSKQFITVLQVLQQNKYYLPKSFMSHTNFNPTTKTKSSGTICGFRPQISDLEPLNIMSLYCQGMTCRNSFLILP